MMNPFLLLTDMKERAQYLRTIGSKPGSLRTVDRNNVYEDVIDLYRSGEIIGEFPIDIRYSGEMAVDEGGVQRDMYSGFWEDAYSKLFDGSTTLIPMINPHMDMSIYTILGRVLSHGFLGSGHLPVRIALPTLIRMLLGPSVEVPSRILKDALLDYISCAERKVFKDALKYALSTKFPAAIQETVLHVLAKFGCRKLPTPANFLSSIKCIAEYEFLTKPLAAICLVHSGIPSTQKGYWSAKSVSDIVSLHEKLTVTAKKVRGLLLLP